MGVAQVDALVGTQVVVGCNVVAHFDVMFPFAWSGFPLNFLSTQHRSNGNMKAVFELFSTIFKENMKFWFSSIFEEKRG